MGLPESSKEAFDSAGLELFTFDGKKGRGVIARTDFKCGDVLLLEKGFHAKNSEKLVSLLLASEEGRHATADLYAGPLHHLQCTESSSQLDGATEEEWLDVYAKVRYNSFQLDGSCLLPRTAMFNHSCRPTAALVRTEPFTECTVAMVVVARDGIASGQEVFLCYDSQLLVSPVHMRRRQLMSAWNFLCKCDRCVAEEEEAEDLKELEGEIADLLVDLKAGNLEDVRLFEMRQDLMHQSGLPFQTRKQMFCAQLAAACALFPHMHPALKDLYQQLQDLCGASPHRDHCESVCKFYEDVCKEGAAMRGLGGAERRKIADALLSASC
ncbi:unnamed protein product [Polarella glacialis]|uniref:SET domain-containing protein n=1 Tax=Polarella glacialis TaxID=89957 RepID=A0A813K961_POLGL|nr:unnamed protein product [Polarella glacialis]